jgi:hypothetical protein
MEERCLGHAGAAIGDGGRRATEMPVGCELGFGFGQMVGRNGLQVADRPSRLVARYSMTTTN